MVIVDSVLGSFPTKAVVSVTPATVSVPSSLIRQARKGSSPSAEGMKKIFLVLIVSVQKGASCRAHRAHQGSLVGMECLAIIASGGFACTEPHGYTGFTVSRVVCSLSDTVGVCSKMSTHKRGGSAGDPNSAPLIAGSRASRSCRVTLSSGI